MTVDGDMLALHALTWRFERRPERLTTHRCINKSVGGFPAAPRPYRYVIQVRRLQGRWLHSAAEYLRIWPDGVHISPVLYQLNTGESML